MRVLQLGNYGDDAGGISSVLREFDAWEWPTAEQAIVDTYASDPRLFGLRRFLVAARTLLRNRREIDVVHIHLSERGSFIREGALVFLASVLRLQSVVTLHGADFVEFADRRPRLVRGVLRRAGQIATLTRATEDAVSNLGFHNVTRVPNAVSIAALPHEGTLPMCARRSVVYAGVVARRKGADLLFEAWPTISRRHPDARLHVYGEHVDVNVPDESSIRAHGKVSRDAVRMAVSEARVFVLPSRAEAFPMAILEAMSAGVPIVSTDVGQIAEMISDPRQVIAPDNTEALVDAVSVFLDDASISAAAGAANAERFDKHYSPHVVARAYEALYGLVVHEGRSG